MLRDVKTRHSSRRYRRSFPLTKSSLLLLGGAVLVVALLIGLSIPGKDIVASPTPSLPETPPVPLALAPVPPPKLESARRIELGTVRSGDTMSTILEEDWGAAQVYALSQKSKDIFPFSDLKAGRSWEKAYEKELLVEFTYEISPYERLIISAQGEGDFRIERRALQFENRITRVSGRIQSSVFDAVLATGEAAELAVRMADIFGWDIDFCRDIQPGDTFQVVVEKKYHDNAFIGYGDVLAIEFVNGGRRFQSFRFENTEGDICYFNENGQAMRKMFLKAPLSFTRISSGFTHSRLHPVLKVRRPHLGVDYAAPKGTPVWTVGDGVVVKKSYNQAAGNFIRIRHNATYETQYNHLSRFAKGLAVGKRYQQGQVIGYVGSTGYATGPHLDYRILKDGQCINPKSLVFPSSDPVPAKRMAEFRSLIDPYRQAFAGQSVDGVHAVVENIESD